MALRAVVVAVICIMITHTFTLERSYWVFLTAFLLITQSFGDGIYRSLARFILTIIGCLIGWVIYLPFANHPPVLVLITLIAIFFMLYWLNSSLIGRTLATGILVVAAFGLMNGGWTFNMLQARILDTFIGAFVAIFVNGLILPEFSKTDMKKAFLYLRVQLTGIHQKLIDSRAPGELQDIQFKLQVLETERLRLVQSYQLARYELLFRKNRKQQYRSLLLQTNIVFSYLNALLDIKIAATAEQDGIKKELAKSGTDYYQNRLNTEFEKLQSL